MGNQLVFYYNPIKWLEWEFPPIQDVTPFHWGRHTFVQPEKRQISVLLHCNMPGYSGEEANLVDF
jgi:hypothetical protein